MTEEKETKSGRRKKWMLVAGTILVIAAVFTCISWNSMHPSKTVTMKELEDYASQELIRSNRMHQRLLRGDDLRRTGAGKRLVCPCR